MTAVEDLSWAYEDFKTRTGTRHYGEVVRTMFIRGGEWVLKRQLEWDGLDESDAIQELRKGEASVFYPLFRDNPVLVVDCPRDGRTTITADAVCDHCLFDFAKGLP